MNSLVKSSETFLGCRKAASWLLVRKLRIFHNNIIVEIL